MHFSNLSLHFMTSLQQLYPRCKVPADVAIGGVLHIL